MKYVTLSQFNRIARLPAADTGTLARRALTAFAVMAAVSLAVPDWAAAEPGAGGLAGSWSGGGWVSFSSGTKERARCRVRYTAQSSSTFRLSGTCATESGRVSQTATVRKSGANAFAGTFYNAEYDVSGSIHVVLRGNSQTATLRSSNGSAVLTLSR